VPRVALDAIPDCPSACLKAHALLPLEVITPKIVAEHLPRASPRIMGSQVAFPAVPAERPATAMRSGKA